ncbi:hypothetical protein D9M68_591960 [compost metagenome]
MFIFMSTRNVYFVYRRPNLAHKKARTWRALLGWSGAGWDGRNEKPRSVAGRFLVGVWLDVDHVNKATDRVKRYATAMGGLSEQVDQVGLAKRVLMIKGHLLL